METAYGPVSLEKKRIRFVNPDINHRDRENYQLRNLSAHRKSLSLSVRVDHHFAQIDFFSNIFLFISSCLSVIGMELLVWMVWQQFWKIRFRNGCDENQSSLGQGYEMGVIDTWLFNIISELLHIIKSNAYFNVPKF